MFHIVSSLPYYYEGAKVIKILLICNDLADIYAHFVTNANPFA